MPQPVDPVLVALVTEGARRTALSLPAHINLRMLLDLLLPGLGLWVLVPNRPALAYIVRHRRLARSPTLYETLAFAGGQDGDTLEFELVFEGPGPANPGEANSAPPV